MLQIHAAVAVGTAATLLAMLLLLLQARGRGRRTALWLIRRWVAADARVAGLVLSLLAAIAGGSFALVPVDERRSVPEASVAASGESTDADPDLAALRAYLGRPPASNGPTAESSSPADDADLPDVGTMIQKLVARLQTQPDDAKGWKMLGWSYLNTGRPADAARAYETALSLEPGDAETRQALEAARSAGLRAMPPRGPEPSPPRAPPEVGAR